MTPYDLARAAVMVLGYHARWIAEAARYQVLGVELEFRAPLRNPDTDATSRTYRLGGKLDVLLRELATGEVLIMEHKTSSADVEPGSDYLKRLRLDGQVTLYFEGARAAGHDVAGVIYDVLVKPALRPLRATPVEARKYTKAGTLYAHQREQDETVDEFTARLAAAMAEAPNDYFLRAHVVRLEQEVKDGMADVWATGRAIRDAELARRHPRNPDACMLPGRKCAFFGVCTGEESLDDGRLFRRSAAVHEELGADRDDLALLSTTRLSTFRACARRHYYRYGLGYRPVVEADALTFGTVIHRALEAWWGAPSDDERLNAAIDALHNASARVAS